MPNHVNLCSTLFTYNLFLYQLGCKVAANLSLLFQCSFFFGKFVAVFIFRGVMKLFLFFLEFYWCLAFRFIEVLVPAREI